MLDMINKVQMFQIACNKVNKSLKYRKLDPVFNLHIEKKNGAVADSKSKESIKEETHD